MSVCLCAGKQIINIRKLKIVPDPIQLDARRANISFDVQIEEDIPPLSKVHLKVWKIRSFLGFEWKHSTPCLFPSGCDVELCSFVQSLSLNVTLCPVKAQGLQNDGLSFEIPELGGFVRWFASGRYGVEMKISGPNSEQLSCYSLKGEVNGGRR
ncbi:uncharacterized protein LOC129968469 [Argiope bruennichi]|uniref:uncharacterized protein LOC129968469 n=1 Tax=Argiope bruennichi TaxID=94029 RepID=UPI002494B78B|nr:uncharacterized protein LOC129968469 [Argiope bruennichi]